MKEYPKNNTNDPDKLDLDFRLPSVAAFLDSISKQGRKYKNVSKLIFLWHAFQATRSLVKLRVATKKEAHAIRRRIAIEAAKCVKPRS